jgi:hypothetical protein
LQHTPSFKSSYEQPQSSCKEANEVTKWLRSLSFKFGPHFAGAGEALVPRALQRRLCSRRLPPACPLEGKLIVGARSEVREKCANQPVAAKIDNTYPLSENLTFLIRLHHDIFLSY